MPASSGRGVLLMALSVVPLGLPGGAVEIVDALVKLTERARDGEFETVYILAFAPGGQYLTKEVGKRHNRLELVGLLESLKLDTLNSTDTAESTGL